jgi:hypothetical protein
MMVAPSLADIRVGYIEVAEGTVPMHLRRAARHALAFGLRDLGLPTPAVRWFDLAPADAPGVLWTTTAERTNQGRCSTTIDVHRVTGEVVLVDAPVWVNRGQVRTLPAPGVGTMAIRPSDGPLVAKTVLHELAHARYALDNGFQRQEGSEPFALAYAAKHRRLTDAMGQPGYPQRRRR